MKKKQMGNLIITTENQNDFKELTQVYGSVHVRKNVTFTAPNLEKCGSVYVRENSSFTAPNLEKCDCVYVNANANFTAPNLEECNYVEVSENSSFTAPNLERSGSVDVNANATFTAPKLKKCGYVEVRRNANFTAPKLEKCGYVDVRENATFISKHFKFKNNIAKFNNKEFKVIFNDGIMFIVESEKTSKEIKIYSGILKFQLENNKVVVSERGFVAEKDVFSAHGLTLKSSIYDLQFKIFSEKLKNEPITGDTEITVIYYRTVTGACDLGCRDFMRDNNIPFRIENNRTYEEKPLKAKDLLPILEKSNAYGLSKFKELIKF